MRSVLVGEPGSWSVRTLKDKSREQVRIERHLQGPVPWITYTHSDGTTLMTNVRLVKRVWTRAVGATGVGEEQTPKVVSPWITPHGWHSQRLALKIDLTGIPYGRGTYWHDCLWYHFHNRGQFDSYAAFRMALKSKCGLRVDHMGGIPEVTNVNRLRLISADASAKQGAEYRQWYKKSGERLLAQRRCSTNRASTTRRKRQQRKTMLWVVKRPAAK